MAERRQEFERDLEAIEARIIELFAMIAEDLPEATNALLTGNNEIMQRLLERDKIISALYPETEQLANREILLQAPVADDLRFLLSVLRVLTEFELSHDLVIQIASRANHFLSGDLSPRARGIVERMGSLASDMWRQAADCWYQRDRSAALAISERDDEMDQLYSSLIGELASGTMTLPVTMEMTLVARFYERLGDHAVIIARRVVYLAGSTGPESQAGSPPE
jgi:phosphate transport system protein